MRLSQPEVKALVSDAESTLYSGPYIERLKAILQARHVIGLLNISLYYESGLISLWKKSGNLNDLNT